MVNCIVDVRLENRSVDPVSAEVRVTVRPEQLTATTQLGGRLMGPSCPYAATVEIAYPLLPLRPGEQSEPGTLGARVVIPEASLWDPQSPFLYGGPIELRQDGQRCDQTLVRHGLRQLSIGPRGLRINGKPLALLGFRLEALGEEQALELRRRGFNLLLVDVSQGTLSVWDLADRLGFLVLGRVTSPALSAEYQDRLSRHPSWLGWLGADEAEPQRRSAAFAVQREGDRVVVRIGEIELGTVTEE
jgi:beta-galactosidase/beta-glucuronidase